MGEEFPSSSYWWLDIHGWNGYYLEWSGHQGYQYVYLFLYYENIILVNWDRGLLPCIQCYDFNITNGKPLFLNSISRTSNLYSPSPWIIGSDFNIIKCLEEKKGWIKMFTKQFCKIYHQGPKVVSIKVLKQWVSNPHMWINDM